MTGLTLAGAAVALGLLAHGVPRTTAQPPGSIAPAPVRMAVILFAFVEGIAVLAVVQGLLAIFADALSEPSAGLFVGLPAVAGAIAGLAIVIRDRDETDSRAATLGMSFVAGLGVLGVAVAMLAATTFTEPGKAAAPDWVYVIFGGGSTLAVLAIGLVGGAGIRAAHALTPAALDDASYRVALNQLIARCIPFLALGWGSGAIAVVLAALSTA